MQSLFTRARTTSQSARAAQAQGASDEFGRVGGGLRSETLPPLPPKKDKEKKDKSKRQRTTSIPKDNRPSFLRSSPEPDLPGESRHPVLWLALTRCSPTKPSAAPGRWLPSPLHTLCSPRGRTRRSCPKLLWIPVYRKRRYIVARRRAALIECTRRRARTARSVLIVVPYASLTQLFQHRPLYSPSVLNAGH